MDHECHHFRDRWEAGDGAVIGSVLPITSFEDEERPSLKEQIVLLFLSVMHLPLHHHLDELKDSLPK